MSNQTVQNDLQQWMTRLTEYIDFLALNNNPNNNQYLPYLIQLLEGVGERLNLEEIKNNYLIRSNLCSISKERLQRAIRYAGGDYNQIKQTGCIDKLNQKINLYIEETTKDIDFELDEKETDLSGKILYLAITGKLTKDTYELTKRNAMASGNYQVLIDKFLHLDKEHTLDPNNPWEHHEYVSRELIDFNSGLFKLNNDQTFAVNLAIFNYLTSKGYDSKATAYEISKMIRNTYNKYNPYVDTQSIVIDEHTQVIFSRRHRFDQQTYYKLIEAYRNYIAILPIELRTLLKRINIEDERNPDDIYWRLEYTKTHDSGATCDYNSGTMNVYKFENDTQGFYQQTISPFNLYHQLHHEAGHAYDYKYASNWGVETDLISSSLLWLDVMKQDQELSGKKSVSEYGENDPREDFADSIFYYCVYPEYMDNFPNRKRLLDEKFKLKKYHPELDNPNPKLD